MFRGIVTLGSVTAEIRSPLSCRLRFPQDSLLDRPTTAKSAVGVRQVPSMMVIRLHVLHVIRLWRSVRHARCSPHLPILQESYDATAAMLLLHQSFNPSHSKGMNMSEQVILSGIRATGRLHFGNFLGAVSKFVQYQQPGNTCLYFVADLHTLTTLDDPEAMRRNILQIVKDYLAAGLDPNQSTIYVQSSVPEIAELTLYLSMFQPSGELEGLPTFKDMAAANPGRLTHGLMTYPVMMTADILGPRATLVPVGKDQIPNVELARGMARRFNNRFGETFVVPAMSEDMIRIPGLDGGKMGKSDGKNAIDINEPFAEMRAKYLKHGVTDKEKVTKDSPGNPYQCKSVYPVHEAIDPAEVSSRVLANRCMAGTLGCVECKHSLVNKIEQRLGPFREARAQWENRTDEVCDILHEGGKRARQLFQPTLEAVREKIGIRIY